METIRGEGGAGINRVPNQPLTVQKMTPPAAKRSSSTGSSTAATATSFQPHPPAVGPGQQPTQGLTHPQPQTASTSSATGADNSSVRF